MVIEKGGFGWIAGLIFCGLACGGVIRQYFSDSFIIVDSKGIQDFRWSWKFVPWEDIDSMWIKRSRYYTGLCIQFRNPEKYFGQMSGVESTIRKPDMLIDWGHLHINTVGLSGNIYAIYDHISKLRAKGEIKVNLR